MVDYKVNSYSRSALFTGLRIAEKLLWQYLCFVAYVPPSFVVALVQTHTIIHNSLHDTVATHILHYTEHTLTVFFTVFTTDCCPCVLVNSDNFLTRNADVIPININSNVWSEAFMATGFSKIFLGNQPCQMNKRNRRDPWWWRPWWSSKRLFLLFIWRRWLPEKILLNQH
jgi:hypothetical protein